MPAFAFASWTLWVSPSLALFTACLSSGYLSVLVLELVLRPSYCSTVRAVEMENWRAGIALSVLEDFVARLRNMFVVSIVGIVACQLQVSELECGGGVGIRIVQPIEK